MMLRILTFVSLLLATTATAKIKVACVGDSITEGAGIKSPAYYSYPAQLGHLLGDRYDVRNFGVSGRTLLSQGDHPYIKEKAYQESLRFQPDIVIIKLGTNDSKPHNWKHKHNFLKNLKNLIHSYRTTGKAKRIILCKPVPVVQTRWGITEKITRNEVGPLIEQAATGSIEIVDLHIPLRNQHQHIPDKIHPNSFGAEAIARHLHRHLTTKRNPKFNIQVTKGQKRFRFHGFDGTHFQIGSTQGKIVRPKFPAQGNPWIWRARFWNHQPQFDIQMLELGYHLVYCDVAGLFGSPDAIKRWENCYHQTQQWGLHKKAILEGMSRGGLIIHNWAVKYPDRVAGIIGDNCVMDFKSWPGGKGQSKGSPNDWSQCKQSYGFKTDTEATNYQLNPVDTITKIKQANIPLLYLIGGKDLIVPPSENANIVIKKLGNYPHLHIIPKPEQKHHPHSLPNPAPVVDFALRCTGKYTNPATLPAPSAEFRGGPAGWGGGIWWDQHKKINQLTKQNPNLELIFLGDSITQSWTGSHHRLGNPKGKRPIDRHFATKYRCASFGISGDRTEHLLFRIQHGNFDGLNPRHVVVMIGVNNLLGGNHHPDDIAPGIHKVAKTLSKKLPKTNIILLGPIPTGHQPEAKHRRSCNQIHTILANYTFPKNVQYHNISNTFLNPDGTLNKQLYVGDGIHLRQPGYEAWAKALLPLLK